MEEELTLLCGHYKDVDQRVAEALATEELSLGDFVLSGGEIAALAVIDAVVRLLPGALGRPRVGGEGLVLRRGAAQPAVVHAAGGVPRTWAVPEVLLSGDHARIAAWRREQSERLTRERRPDLWGAHHDGRQGIEGDGG